MPWTSVSIRFSLVRPQLSAASRVSEAHHSLPTPIAALMQTRPSPASLEGWFPPIVARVADVAWGHGLEQTPRGPRRLRDAWREIMNHLVRSWVTARSRHPKCVKPALRDNWSILLACRLGRLLRFSGCFFCIWFDGTLVGTRSKLCGLTRL